ncbi:MAG TPA: SpoIID/LytB domain-containing protein, partial [Acidimicrobiia bacterium]|nr:SpoIID/LytB domain-containing protein [Acidimicrobiia bacterium]
MRPGPRLLAALVAGGLAISAPAAQAKGSGTKKPTSPPRVPALVTDVARIEPLPAAPGSPWADGRTVALDGVGEYRGILELRRNGPGVGAVNEVALDDYLKGISEVPSSWPAEALRAQAIAARTYLLWTLASPPAGDAAALGAQICATDSCQVYSGVAKERAPGGPSWAAAVGDTAGEVLVSGGAPILAKYSACNGGRSVSGGKPYLKAVDDPDDARCPLSRWGLSVPYDDLGRALAVPGTVRAVRGGAGDVEVDWTGADGAGGHLTVPHTDFRAKVGAAVGPPPDRSKTVPSILFTIRGDDAGRVATLDGRGYGHGIGMSQWGAYGKALRGMKAGTILAAYYGGIQPTRVPAPKLPARVRVAIDTGAPPPAPKPAPATSAAGRPGTSPGGAGQSGTPSGGAGPSGTPAGGAPPSATPSGGSAAAKKAPPAPARPAPGAASAVVSASGPFRVLDSAGKVVVPFATGSWRVVPAAKGLQLLPPRDQAGPPGLTVLGIDPAAPLLGQPFVVRFRSNLPGYVSATASPPGGAPAPVLAPRLAGTDEVRLTLPAAIRPGPYSLTLAADAGPGRTADLTVNPVVIDPAAPPPGPDGGPPTISGLLGRPGLLGAAGLPAAGALNAVPGGTFQ